MVRVATLGQEIFSGTSEVLHEQYEVFKLSKTQGEVEQHQGDLNGVLERLA